MQAISIVIPALNEKDAIFETIQGIPRKALEEMDYEVQVLVVDNGSNDGTGELARQAGAEVIFEPRTGYGRAFRTGFSQASGQIIVTLDADLTYPVEDVPRLVKILEEENVDFISTNRFALMQKGVMPLRNRVGNTILSLAVWILFNINIRDPESGMWIFRKSILDKLKLKSDFWPFSHELKLEACYYAKYRWKEVPIQYKARQGNSKLVKAWEVGLIDLLHILGKRIRR
jgi:glycosyltransferase involved in cell wall biosynthesis